MKKDNNSWQVKSLGEIFDIFPGGTPSRNVDEYWGGDIPWVKISDMLQSTITYTEENISEVGLANSSAKIIPKGSLLISIFATVGRTAFLDIDATTNQAIVGLVAKEQNLDLNFVRYYLDFKVDKLKELSRGVAQNNINKSILSGVKIPLPPLPIQKQIAEILGKADEAKQKRKAANKLTDEFLQSVFIEMFGDPVKNPKGLEKYPLTEICLEIIDCPHSTPIHSNSITEYPCIRTTEMKNGYIDWTNMKYLDLEQYTLRISRLEPKEGDVIFAREGIFGEAIRVPPRTKISLGQRTLLFSPNHKKIISEYLWAFVRSQGFYQQATARNSGSTVAHINVKDIRNFGILLPPLSLQQQFAEIVNKTEVLKEKQRQSEQELENLYQSLMQKAFKGELVS